MRLFEKGDLCEGSPVIEFAEQRAAAVIRRNYRAEFEDLGPDEVRKRESGAVWSEEKSRAARQWLRRDSNQIARNAKNAAWIAAIAATVSAIAAVVGMVLCSKH